MVSTQELDEGGCRWDGGEGQVLVQLLFPEKWQSCIESIPVPLLCLSEAWVSSSGMGV